MEKLKTILETAVANIAAEKTRTPHLDVAASLIKSAAERLGLHLDAAPAPAPTTAAPATATATPAADSPKK